MHELEHGLAELCLAQEQQARVAGVVGRAVACRLRGDVGEVDALAEHVAIDGRLGRGDAQALGEDAAEVGGARAMPEKTAVGVEVGEGAVGEAGVFALAGDAEDVFDLWGISVRLVVICCLCG